MNFLWLIVIAHTLWGWRAAIRRGLAASRKKLTPTFALTGEPFISVLIPAWKEKAVLGATLLALQSSEYKNWEAIVIAGGNDGTEDYAREFAGQRPNFKVISQPPKGKNAALNLGLAQAKGDTIIFLDADTIVTPGWLAALAAPLTNGFDAATANYSPATCTWVSAHFEMQKVSACLVGESASLHGGGFAARRELLDRIGSLPEEVTVGVDWDFDQRVNTLRARKIFVPGARHVTHLAHSLRSYLRDETRWRRAHLQNIFYRRQWLAFSFYASAILFYLAPCLLFSPLPELWPLLWAWILLRRLSLSLEIIAFERRWLKYLCTPLLLLPVDFLAGILALLTIRRKLIHFKGSRPNVTSLVE